MVERRVVAQVAVVAEQSDLKPVVMAQLQGRFNTRKATAQNQHSFFCHLAYDCNRLPPVLLMLGAGATLGIISNKG